MTTFNVRYDDKEVQRSLKRLRTQYPAAEKAFLKEMAGSAVNKAKFKYVPVRTGNLQSTIRVEVRPDGIFMVSGGIDGAGNPSQFVDYAQWVNDGTSRIAPSLFMERGADDAVNDKDSIANRIIQSWLRNLS